MEARKWAVPFLTGVLVFLLAGLMLQSRQLQTMRIQMADCLAATEALQTEVDRLLAEQTDLQEKYEEAVAPEPPDNPIDKCFLELFDEYGNSHTDGWLYYLEGEAWKAELYYAAEQVKAGLTYQEDIQAVDDYLRAVEELADARRGLSYVQEGNTAISPDEPSKRLQWAGTGYSGRVSRAIACVYSEAFQNFSDYGPWGHEYQFDADEAKNQFLGSD